MPNLLLAQACGSGAALLHAGAAALHHTIRPAGAGAPCTGGALRAHTGLFSDRLRTPTASVHTLLLSHAACCPSPSGRCCFVPTAVAPAKDTCFLASPDGLDTVLNMTSTPLLELAQACKG